MLKIHFLNVGDGDCVLIEDLEGGRAFRMLVDTGRDAVCEGWPAATAREHLERLGIKRLDKLLITHLHVDHAGGLSDLIGNVAIDELISGYIPPITKASIPQDNRSVKTVRAMTAHVNQWIADVGRLRKTGCQLVELTRSSNGAALTERLTADWILPNRRAGRMQRDVWTRMLERKKVPESQKIYASKLRNPNSIRLRLHYAGRTVELTADCYGSEWDMQTLLPCDIFKAPHHGDRKSVTETLIDKLRPAHAVICCGHDYLPVKDRPSESTAALLRAAGCRIWYTDRFDNGVEPVRVWPSVDFTILEDGRLFGPTDQEKVPKMK